MEAAYAAISVRGVLAALEATVTRAPEPRGIIRSTTARETWKTPVALTAKVAAQSSSEKVRTGPRRRTPAALTR